MSEIATRRAESLAETVERLLLMRRCTLRELAGRSGIRPSELEQYVEGSRPAPVTVVAILARALDADPREFASVRLYEICTWLLRRSDQADALFLEALTPLERSSIDATGFDARPLAEVIRERCREDGVAQPELAEAVGATSAELGYLLAHPLSAPVELLEAVADAVGVAPETLLAYRVAVVRDWLEQHAGRADAIHAGGLARLSLRGYVPWRGRACDPLGDAAQALRNALEVVAVEGPVVASRVGDAWLAAAGVEPSPARSDRVRRCLDVLADRGHLVVARHERVPSAEPTLRLAGAEAVVPRTRGPRTLAQIPADELAAVAASTSARRRGESVARVQAELAALYELRAKLTQADIEYVNRCISSGGGAPS